jgi:hypothetical protein
MIGRNFFFLKKTSRQASRSQSPQSLHNTTSDRRGPDGVFRPNHTSLISALIGSSAGRPPKKLGAFEIISYDEFDSARYEFLQILSRRTSSDLWLDATGNSFSRLH